MTTDKISALIVDDEESSRATLSKIIDKYCPSINIVGKAANADEAYELIISKEPELVFLDVEMPHASGFDLLERFPSVDFNVIFTTAYDQYALNAIKCNAVDYLLKPINIKELIQAVEKIGKGQRQQNEVQDAIQSLMSSYRGNVSKNEKIGISTKAGVEFINIQDVVRCEADGSYTKIFLKNNKKILATGKIKGFEELLTEHQFVRVHNSHLININCLEQYIRGEGGIAIMNDGAQVPISRRKKDEFLTYLQIV